MKMDGRFWLNKDGKNFLGAGRVELLHKIEKTGSINAAAKEMKMSYKAAWERINGMNALADEPLIERKIGGAGGGGTTLTPYAHELIKTYERFNELHRQFIDRFSEVGSDTERLARLLSRTFLTTSARNQIPTTITSIEEKGLYSRVEMALTPEHTLTSIITTTSVKNMGLEIGSEVYAIIKSSDILISQTKPEHHDDENIFEGSIKEIAISDDFTEVSFALSDIINFVAFLNKDKVNSLKAEMPAYALIHSKSIIIGL